eukprot:CAMPEP_0118931436 /NCGR_PEP_ID=MMETSP1169-20130426/7777_1 /TAXON_ID=36882 /ORGANISM="Pyramimonas obovata, Strain CCMP722" /LENGTH=156 /DNA_ID=CAMNT_0006873935 /DNA_START=56 /DNA_END=526 /DNA_ORIENTATION=+
MKCMVSKPSGVLATNPPRVAQKGVSRGRQLIRCAASPGDISGETVALVGLAATLGLGVLTSTSKTTSTTPAPPTRAPAPKKQKKPTAGTPQRVSGTPGRRDSWFRRNEEWLRRFDGNAKASALKLPGSNDWAPTQWKKQADVQKKRSASKAAAKRK